MAAFVLLLILPALSVYCEITTENPRDNSIVKFNGDSDSTSDDPKTRILGPAALETIGRFFLTQSQFSSCYSCSSNYPEHARSCCQEGYVSCCYGNSYGYPDRDYNYVSTSRVKPGECPYASPYSQSHCSRQCVTDTDCHGDYKCCSYGCSTFCASPLRTSVTTYASSFSRYEKPGVCPSDYYGSYDDYRNGYGGYGYSSQDSYRDRLYFGGKWTYGSRDTYDCVSDSECPGSQKCCLRRFNKRSCVSVHYSISYGKR